MTERESDESSDALDGRVCVVAGGGNGVGAAVARSLAAHGASVVVNDVGADVHGEGEDPEAAREVARDIREAGGTAVAHPGDAADLDYALDLVSETVDEFGRLDAVANFAGILRDDLSYRIEPEDWEAVQRAHLRSHFALLRASAAHWRDAAGDDGLSPQRSFIGVSALSAMGNVGQVSYASAKAGVLGLVRSASSELYRYGVRVNALAPSAYTRMTETIPEEHRPYTREEMPPGALGPVVAYLVSDAAADVTGVTVTAGGDRVGIMRDPEVTRLGVREGGWSVSALDDAFRDLAEGYELTRTDSHF
ncbi:MAG: SDR family oxidoreductase [Halarchaeum sp.]